MVEGILEFNARMEQHLIRKRSFLNGRSSYLPFYLRMKNHLKKQESLRKRLFRQEDLIIPPIMIISVTRSCNLRCAGCYAEAAEKGQSREISLEEIDRLIREGLSLGVGLFFLAGGEPLMKEGLLDILRKYTSTPFVLFTNGLLVDQALTEKIGKIKNLTLAFSLEGNQAFTDSRRGCGVFRSVHQAMERMDRHKTLFGASVTLTRENYDQVMTPAYLSSLRTRGCRLLFLIEYVPCQGDRELCLRPEQKQDLLVRTRDLSAQYGMLPIPLPGDEEAFGGCLAAGRGFVHVNAGGDLEACPFAPYADRNIRTMSLKEALQSKMLGEIRDNHHLLTEAEGGCTLYENKEWVEALL